MSKIRLTEKQAEALEQAKEGRGKDKVMNGIGGKWYRELEPLNDLTPNQMARALYIGYEVEPEFKENDWVVAGINREPWRVTCKILEVNHLQVATLDSMGLAVYLGALRHATPEEIAEEKERRMDKKLDGLLLDLNNDEKARLQKILSNEKKKPNF